MLTGVENQEFLPDRLEELLQAEERVTVTRSVLKSQKSLKGTSKLDWKLDTQYCLVEGPWVKTILQIAVMLSSSQSKQSLFPLQLIQKPVAGWAQLYSASPIPFADTTLQLTLWMGPEFPAKSPRKYQPQLIFLRSMIIAKSLTPLSSHLEKSNLSDVFLSLRIRLTYVPLPLLTGTASFPLIQNTYQFEKIVGNQWSRIRPVNLVLWTAFNVELFIGRLDFLYLIYTELFGGRGCYGECSGSCFQFVGNNDAFLLICSFTNQILLGIYSKELLVQAF